MKILGAKQGFFAVAAVTLLLATGCEQKYNITTSTALTSPEEPGGPPSNKPSPSPACVDSVEDITANIRILFMVDQSGSTFDNTNTSLKNDGTDPNYVYRKKAIDSFIQQYGHKTNFSYSFGYFRSESSTNLARLFDYNGSGTYRKTSDMNANSIYFGSSSQLSTALSKYLQVSQDVNAGTPYDEAFNADRFAVLKDVDSNRNKYQYVMIFMSDGLPNPGRSSDQLKALIKNTRDAVKGSSSSFVISGVYFGPSSASDAISKVKLIAKEGGGQFVDTNETPNFTIEDVIKVSVCK